MLSRRDQLLADCRRFRADLLETVAELKAARADPSVSRRELKVLDERIFNCECSIARFEIVIMETEAKGVVLSQPDATVKNHSQL